MHLPVLSVGCGKANIKIVPSLVCFHFFIPPAANTVEDFSGEDIGERSGDLM